MLTRRKKRILKRVCSKWKKIVRDRVSSNDVCPITLERVCKLGKVFQLISPNMLRRGYDAVQLAEYFKNQTHSRLRDPESKCRITSNVLKRLQRVSGVGVYDEWLRRVKENCAMICLMQLGLFIGRTKQKLLDESVSCNPYGVFCPDPGGEVPFLLIAFHLDRPGYENMKNELMTAVLTSPNEESRSKSNEWMCLIHMFHIVASNVEVQISFNDTVCCVYFVANDSKDALSIQNLDLNDEARHCLSYARDIITGLHLKIPLLSGFVVDDDDDEDEDEEYIEEDGDTEEHADDEDDEEGVTDQEGEDGDTDEHADDEVGVPHQVDEAGEDDSESENTL